MIEIKWNKFSVKSGISKNRNKTMEVIGYVWNKQLCYFHGYYFTAEILFYHKTWENSDLTVSVCRAIGIPCRTVTNFSSAHDTDGSVTVDVHWDTDGNSELTSLNSDSIW